MNVAAKLNLKKFLLTVEMDSTGSGKSTVADLMLSVFNIHTGFWWGNLKERGHLQNPSLEGSIILKCTFKK
jgi:hypothetical protein